MGKRYSARPKRPTGTSTRSGTLSGMVSGHEGRTVARPSLVERLTASRTPLVVIEAPAGYGKSTLADLWLRDDERRSERIAIGYHDETSLRLASSSIKGTDPVVLVLDNVERLRDADQWTQVPPLLDAMPAGSALALVGRHAPLPRLARLRAEGAVTEVGIPDLRMDEREIAEMVRALGSRFDRDEIPRLARRTEGWPVAIALGVLSQDGDDRALDDYVRTEIVAALTEKQRRFLLRISVLEWLSGELCDVALRSRTSGRTLTALRSAAVPLFPIEGRRWRLHPVVREFLRAEIAEEDPAAIEPIARRASVWCEEHGFLDAAIPHAQTAGDVDRVADLTVRSSLVGSWIGALPTIHARLRWIADRVPLEQYPFAAATGAWVHINTGNATVADRLTAAAARSPLDTIGPDGSPLRAWVSLLRAALSHDGVEQSRADAMWALEGLAPGSPWRAPAWLIFGIGCAVSGEWGEADAALADAAAEAAEDSSFLALSMTLGQRSLVAIHDERWADAASFAKEGIDLLAGAGTEVSWAACVARVAAAQVAVHAGDVDAASEHLAHASGALAHLTRAIPAVSVQTRLEAARAYLALGASDTATSLLEEADDVLRRFPKMRELATRSEEIHRQLQQRTDGTVRLTKAEHRLLPLLATHKTFQAIADELFLSPHTVKAEAISIYRKLGQTSRGATVARAREIGLIRT
jgi:LuxR family maltose regulon positive regulatory protein